MSTTVRGGCDDWDNLAHGVGIRALKVAGVDLAENDRQQLHRSASRGFQGPASRAKKFTARRDSLDRLRWLIRADWS